MRLKLRLIFLILVVASILRFYNLPENFIFAGDEEHQTILAQSLVKDFHIIWIGVNAAHTGFYLGPYWTYFTAFWLWLSQGNPLITAYVASAIGVLTTLMVILTGTVVFDRKVGLVAGLLYATLPLMVFFDQRYWNPSLIPLLSSFIFLSLCKLKENPKLAIPLGVSFGLIFHTHLSLVPLIFVAIFWVIWKRIKLPKKVIVLSLVTFTAMIMPLIIFDLFHQGSNITTPLRFKEISAERVNNIKPLYHLNALFQTMGRVWYLKPYTINSDEIIAPCAVSSRTDTTAQLGKFSNRFNPPVLLSVAGASILLLFLLNKKSWNRGNSMLLALFILTIIISFLIFPGASFEYYLLGIFPLLLFLPGILIDYLAKYRYLIYSLICLASVMGIWTVLTNDNVFGFASKRSLVRQVKLTIGNERFDLKQTGICHAHEAWRYLFLLEGLKPERSDSDAGLGWLYPAEISEKPAKYTVVLSEERVPIDFDVTYAKILHQKGFKAYIFERDRF